MFGRFLESRNRKIQRQAHVGRKSAVVLSGRLEAPYSHFFIGIDFNCSRSRFHCLSNNCHPEDSEHSGSGRIEFSSKSTTFRRVIGEHYSDHLQSTPPVAIREDYLGNRRGILGCLPPAMPLESVSLPPNGGHGPLGTLDSTRPWALGPQANS